MAGARLLVALLTCWSACCPCEGGPSRRGRSLDARDALAHQNDFYLPRAVVPRAYRLQLVPDLDRGLFRGRVWINVTCLEATDSITLHAHQSLNTSTSGLTVRRLPRQSPGEEDEGEDVSVSSTKKNFAKQWYIILLGEKLQKSADYELHIAFSGQMNDATSEAFFRGIYHDFRSQEYSWYAATAMEATKARQVFPCFDEPALKATFQISVGARRRYHVWSGMQLTDTEDMLDPPGWLWHHFPPTPLMSTFSVGVFISDFHYATAMLPTGGYIRLSSRPELLERLEKVNKLSAKAFEFAEEYLNISYPLEKLDVVVLPTNSSDFSSDSWGFVMLRESDLADEQASAKTVVGSVLMQWLGHLATPYWWSSIGVHTALVTHLTNQFMAQELGMSAGETGYPLYQTYSQGSLKTHPSAITGHEYTDRALRLLRLLNYSLTENTFRQAIHIFLEDRQYKTFTEYNLWAALTARGKQDHTLAEDVTIEDVARSWLGKERYPVVVVTRNYDSDTAVVEQHVFLRERPQNISGKDRMLWYIPVMYISADNMSTSDMRPVTWMKNERRVTISDLPPEDKFIIVNPDNIGTFLVNYDARNWQLLTRALEAGGIIGEQTRAKLLHDSWNLAFAGELNFAIALDVTLFLAGGERALPVWDSFFAMVDRVRRHLDGTDIQPMFDEYAGVLVEQCLRTLGPAMAEDDDGTRKLREAAEVLRRVVSHPHSDVSSQQDREAWVEGADPVQYAKIRDVPLESVLGSVSLEQFQAVLQHAVRLLSKGLLEDGEHVLISLARAAPRQQEKVDSLLNVLLVEDPHVGMAAAVRRACIAQLSEQHDGSVATMRFVHEHWDQVRDRLDSDHELWKMLMSAATARLITKKDLDMFEELYAKRRGHFGVAELLVEKELERVEQDAVWTRDNHPVIRRWLEEFLEDPPFPLGLQTSTEAAA